MSPVWRAFGDPQLQLRLAILIAALAVVCLVAIWAATGKRHWFWRVVAVWGAVMAMVPIWAWEAAWLFGLSLPLAATAIAAGRRWGSRPEDNGGQAEANSRTMRWRFSLLDMLLLM